MPESILYLTGPEFLNGLHAAKRFVSFPECLGTCLPRTLKRGSISSRDVKRRLGVQWLFGGGSKGGHCHAVAMLIGPDKLSIERRTCCRHRRRG